jgi:hypothetical protein
MSGVPQLLGEPAPRLRDVIGLIGRHHCSVEMCVAEIGILSRLPDGS